MRFTATALILLAATVSSPVIAGDPKPAQQEETEQKKEVKKAKKICKRVSDMGSRRSTRLCMTRAEWVDFNQGN